MTLRLFDTATQGKRPFHPLVDGRVSLYVCGATVQAPPHVGHMRSGVAFDVLRRWFIAGGSSVTFVRNVTDIDDKILDRAAETGIPWWAIAAAVERDFHDAYQALGCLPPTIEPRATGHIPDMIALTERLLSIGVAYARAGDVYFSVAKAPDYGALSGQEPANLRSRAASTTPREDKDDPRDFALWKGAKPGEPDTAAWQTPWGRARPGWHLECSAMSTRYLGSAFDIHGGGRDLVFPHHENERAQSRTAGDPFAQYWVHNAWVTVDGEKMSKSLDNALSIRDLLALWDVRSLRYWLVSGHYRSVLEYSPDALRDATAAAARIDTFLSRARDRRSANGQAAPNSDLRVRWTPASRPDSEWTDRFAAALDDDLNTAQALAVVHEAVRSGNAALDSGDAAQTRRVVEAVSWMTDILGITEPAAPAVGPHNDELVQVIVDERDHARQVHDYDRADHIRRALLDQNIEVLDTPAGSSWRLR